MLKTRLMKVQILLALGAILLASCGGGNAPEATPTLGVNQIQTFAVATFSSALTMTAMAAPTNTPAPTQTPATPVTTLATNTGAVPVTGITPGAPVGGVAATSSCYGLTFVSDVTIPDNTQMDPGETFTKTWKVQELRLVCLGCRLQIPKYRRGAIGDCVHSARICGRRSDL